MIASVLVALLHGGRAAAVRFVLTASGVSIAAIFLLAALGYPHARASDGVPAAERVAVLALLALPMLMLVALSALVGMRMRARRLAALRMLGATPGYVAAMTALETGLAALAGVAVGALAFSPARAVVDQLGLARLPFPARDLAPPIVPSVAILAALVLFAGGVVLVTLRSELLHPFAARASTRQATLGSGRVAIVVVSLIGFAAAPLLEPGAAAVLGSIASVLGVAVGLLACGPWITQQGSSRALLGASDRPAALLAGRWLGTDRPGGFRAPALIMVVVGTLVGTIILSASLAGAEQSASGEQPIGGAQLLALTLLGLFLVTGIVGTVIGAVDGAGGRRRELGLLRACGVRHGTLRGALALEQAAPLMTAIMLGTITGAGLPIFGFFLAGQRGVVGDLRVPWLTVAAVVGAATAVGLLAASAAALALGGRIPPEALRPD